MTISAAEGRRGRMPWKARQEMKSILAVHSVLYLASSAATRSELLYLGCLTDLRLQH